MDHHKELPPSSAPAIMECACYVSDSVAGAAAKRGTVIHECLAAAMEGQPMPHQLQGEDMEEMLWALAYIMGKRTGTGEMQIEEKVEIKGADGVVISFGHADAYELE